MDTETFDAIVIGAGMAGATVAAHLAPDRSIALVEAEAAAGYHSTGRSAAMYVRHYGPPDVRALTRLSRAFFDSPPPGFTDHALLTHRATLYLARASEVPDLECMLGEAQGPREIGIAEAASMVPALRLGYAARAAIDEEDCDIDVAALHQGFLRRVASCGGKLVLNSRVLAMKRSGGLWEVATASGSAMRARVLVDAAGAWGDAVAGLGGVRPLGLSPCRRTGVIIDAAPFQPEHWPNICDVGNAWYARPEARTKLMVSPADETPVAPQDVRPEELDIALAIDRMQEALAIPVTRVERSWAGLRTFTPDGSLAFGWDKDAEGFFWCVGQGGYGIQTAPAAGRLVAAMITGRDPLEAGSILAAIDPSRFALTSAESGVGEVGAAD